MSHLIQEYDLTFSVSSPEWHGLAVIPDGATDSEKFGKMPQLIRENLCPPVLPSFSLLANYLRANGETVSQDSETSGDIQVAADCFDLPNHSSRAKHPNGMVTLGVHKDGYHIFQNERFLEIAENAFDSLGVPMTIATAGTLGNMKRFYFSVLMDEFQIVAPDGHSIKSYLAFLTSHDGVWTPTIKDSHTKPVCANTVGAITRELANFVLTGKHTTNGLASLDNLGPAIEAFAQGTKTISAEYEKLANIPTDYQTSREIAAGYAFADLIASKKRIPDNVTMTTQAFNTAEEITQLSRTGKGNDGSSLYSLYNGATDFWSNGNGAGSMKVGISKRVSRSHFGQAAEHKSAFHRYLVDEETREQGREIGAKALKNYALAKA